MLAYTWTDLVAHASVNFVCFPAVEGRSSNKPLNSDVLVLYFYQSRCYKDRNPQERGYG